MVDNTFTIFRQNFPIEFTENFQILDTEGNQNLFGANPTPVSDVHTSTGMEKTFDLVLITHTASPPSSEARISHRNVTVPITPAASPISINNFITQISDATIDIFVLERERTDTDIIYDVFYFSDNVAGDNQRRLTVVTFTLEPGETLPTFSVPSNSVISNTVLRSKEGNKRTYDVFVFS